MSKDIDHYRSYYDRNFYGVSGGSVYDYESWINYKAATFSKYDQIFIRTRIEDFAIQDNQLKLTIRQKFTGTGPTAYSDDTLKALTFKKVGDAWTIVSERPI